MTISKLLPISLILTGLATSQISGAALPDPGMQFEAGHTALVVTDPQNDFLSPDGVAWGVVGKSVIANRTVENIDNLFKTAKANNVPVFVSSHYYFPHDHGWKFEGA